MLINQFFVIEYYQCMKFFDWFYLGMFSFVVKFEVMIESVFIYQYWLYVFNICFEENVVVCDGFLLV